MAYNVAAAVEWPRSRPRWQRPGAVHPGGRGEGRPKAWDLQQLLERPNPFYSGRHLWSATLADLMLSGYAYWRKVGSAGGRTVQLWWIPSTLLEPKWPDDGLTYISHY